MRVCRKSLDYTLYRTATDRGGPLLGELSNQCAGNRLRDTNFSLRTAKYSIDHG